MFHKTTRCFTAAALASVTLTLVMAAGAAAGGEIEYFRTDTPEFMASAKQGKQLFEAYQCALCHATREGQPLTKDIIAPNLIMAKDRLRPEWILEWIIDPQKLQPGTKMPNFFSFNTDDKDNIILTDADAHAQFKMIVSLRDYLMVMGTPKEAELDKVGDDGRPLPGMQSSATESSARAERHADSQPAASDAEATAPVAAPAPAQPAAPAPTPPPAAAPFDPAAAYVQ